MMTTALLVLGVGALLGLLSWGMSRSSTKTTFRTRPKPPPEAGK